MRTSAVYPLPSSSRTRGWTSATRSGHLSTWFAEVLAVNHGWMKTTTRLEAGDNVAAELSFSTAGQVGIILGAKATCAQDWKFNKPLRYVRLAPVVQTIRSGKLGMSHVHRLGLTVSYEGPSSQDKSPRSTTQLLSSQRTRTCEYGRY